MEVSQLDLVECREYYICKAHLTPLASMSIPIWRPGQIYILQGTKMPCLPESTDANEVGVRAVLAARRAYFDARFES